MAQGFLAEVKIVYPFFDVPQPFRILVGHPVGLADGERRNSGLTQKALRRLAPFVPANLPEIGNVVRHFLQPPERVFKRIRKIIPGHILEFPLPSGIDRSMIVHLIFSLNGLLRPPPRYHPEQRPQFWTFF
jgi:hypothetical protein